MRAFLCVLAFACVAAAEVPLQVKQKDPPVPKIEGKWKCVSYISNGEDLKIEEVMKLTVTKDTWHETAVGKTVIKCSYKLEGGKIHMTVLEGGTKGLKHVGLYQLSKDGTLRVCWEIREGETDAFESKGGSNRFLSSWKRIR